ncbi:hypothetical protein [Xanthomonas citri]|uniref:hypothetical protein n=1 Tax=Xanthomonas citri TaxID=346 RepID=UPI001E5CB53F|nr:hypothetical protein [Xanthomonas citri]MCC8492161.1 hypothetical protein [Xanthomonas citri pv. fuscans]
MSIIRAPRPESNYYVLSKAISEDGRLSWAARGLLVYLLGKPDHWQVNVESLRKQTDGARIRTGRDGLYALLAELEKAGYLQRQRQRGDGGRLSDVDYSVSEIPARPRPSNPEMVAPHPAQPDTAQPYPANPTLVSNDYKQELRGSKAPVVPAGDAGAGELELTNDQHGEQLCPNPIEVIRATYNRMLGSRPGCVASMATTPLLDRKLRKADANARKTCKAAGVIFEPAEFWEIYFGVCLDDPWLRGDRPNPNNLRWKQSLPTLIDDERFEQIMNTALAAMEVSA